ncbi:cbs domain-containing protein [Phlyctema vagabunda]|uniref:Cbs domain-containing protein n=1 Tax=Phlyctema vagabunda TaxID=108571 RepID=A0ABR4PSL7_9HELO
MALNAKFKWALLKRSSNRGRDAGPSTPRQRQYEDSTGQVFDETIVPMQTTSDHQWTRQDVVASDPYCARNFREYWDHCNQSNKYEQVLEVKPAKGARSLADIVVEFLVQNVADITPEALECLPLQVVRRLWVEVSHRMPVSFEIWQMFSRILQKEPTTTLNILSYRHQIKLPLSPLEVYATPLTSTSFDFITSLSIRVAFPIQDLASLSKMTNIGVLEIFSPPSFFKADGASSGPFPAIGDALVRAFARAASESGAFPVLRVLKLYNQEGITNQSLAYLNSFKSLGVYDVSGSSVTESSGTYARELGWRISRVPDTASVLYMACEERDKIFGGKLKPENELPEQRANRQPDIFDRATVKRIPRSEIPKLFVERRFKSNLPEDEAGHRPTKPEPKNSIARLPRSENEQPARAKGKNEIVKGPSRFDTPNLACFARIGELRNDKDLAAAGIEIGDQPVVGSELIPPVPVVSIQLGKNNPVRWIHLSGADIKIFIRIKVPIPAAQPRPADMSSAQVGEINEQEARDRNNRARGRPLSTFGPVRSRKKQKLENVLDSFL